jgi:hypothetical protein
MSVISIVLISPQGGSAVSGGNFHTVSVAFDINDNVPPQGLGLIILVSFISATESTYLCIDVQENVSGGGVSSG